MRLVRGAAAAAASAAARSCLLRKGALTQWLRSPLAAARRPPPRPCRRAWSGWHAATARPPWCTCPSRAASTAWSTTRWSGWSGSTSCTSWPPRATGTRMPASPRPPARPPPSPCRRWTRPCGAGATPTGGARRPPGACWRQGEGCQTAAAALPSGMPPSKLLVNHHLSFHPDAGPPSPPPPPQGRLRGHLCAWCGH